MGVLLFISGQEIIFVFLIVLVLFGSKRIPEFAKMMGKGMSEFRKATDDIKRQINEETNNFKDDVDDFKKSLKP